MMPGIAGMLAGLIVALLAWGLIGGTLLRMLARIIAKTNLGLGDAFFIVIPVAIVNIALGYATRWIPIHLIEDASALLTVYFLCIIIPFLITGGLYGSLIKNSI